MSYNYEQCFWDPNDDGVNILLEHISSGIRSCDTMVSFFKQRSELEKDYARRLGAIGSKLSKDMEEKTEFGHLCRSFNLILTTEKSRAQAHSKQSEVINRQIYSDIKMFAQNLQAKYVTISSKIEKLRLDKYSKRKGCEDLSKRLEEAQIRARDLQLNQNNIIGSRKVEQNKKELAKWESNSQEIRLQLDVLRQEARSSQKFWFKEWANMTHELQEMEVARISFLQSKMQQYAQATTETSLLEQARMDTLTNYLVTFTPADDIKEFSNSNGTGRLREKRQTSNTTQPTELRESVSHLQSHKRDSYAENIRKLSSQLQKQTPKQSNKYNSSDHEPQSQAQSLPRPQVESSQSTSFKPTIREIRVVETPKLQDRRDEEVTRYSPPRLQTESPRHHKATSSSSSGGSSIPTDFTTHVKNRASIDSMTTSVSSLASSIDDSQRFAKSWNSSNRKRKSMSHLQQHHQEQARQPPSPATSNESYGVNENSQLRSSSTSTTIVNHTNPRAQHLRRKSMVLQDSKTPIEDALYEMERIKSIGSENFFGSSDARLGHVKDNGATITLPIVTSQGDPVIKYAKAVYPLSDNGAPEVAHFQKGDYILISSVVNEDWFRGEVYENSHIETSHSVGLIPYNFIKLLT